jgi:penicillin G amidase
MQYRSAAGRTALALICLLRPVGFHDGSRAIIHAQTGALESSVGLDALAKRALAQIDGTIRTPGLKAPVQVVRDRWGVPHIAAQSTEDLFFAQGFVMAQDRLWQMEVWRRTNEGRLAEIVGPAAVSRDRTARLLKYRGPLDENEFSSYHPEGRRIMTAFVAGINAFISQNANRLPVEFVLTGVKPEPWTIETLILRTPGFGEASAELQLARSVAQFGAEEANRRRNPDPWDDLRVPDGLDVTAIDDAVLSAARGSAGAAPQPEILPQYRDSTRTSASQAANEIGQPGSNNWVVSGARSATGMPVVSNDPHRNVTLPSLRYIVHLQAPGWNVVGAVEPPFLGVAIGHNERVAWGLTIVGTDQEDVYVESVNPANDNEVRFNGAWEPLRSVREEIKVKGQPSEFITVKFSRHGPIFYEDKARKLAYAVRRAAAEPGTAPYLAGLRLSQTRNCREFLEAAMFWKAPTENLICGDVDGNIAWRPAALSPSRQGWVGRLPVPGGGRYEWQGFRQDLPFEFNPPRGFIATANDNINPPGYQPPLMFKIADTRFDRITRVRQMFAAGEKLGLPDHERMQHDAYSLRAASDLPLFRDWTSSREDVERARRSLAGWDATYTKDSLPAALYEAWRTPEATGRSGNQAAPRETSREGLERGLAAAIARVTREQGVDWSTWRWGRMHQRTFPHPLVKAFDLPTVERPGGAGTVAADGATYREILDVANWDASLTVNVPGQSGQPGSPFYGNLLTYWADNKYFPMVYTQAAVDAAAAHRLTLQP